MIHSTANTFAGSSAGELEDCSIMPVQYYDSVGRSQQREGEQRLMLAVLEDAIRVYLNGAGRLDHDSRAEFDEVRHWLFATTDRGVFSYENICTVLEIEPKSLRRRLKWIREAQLGSLLSAQSTSSATIDRAPSPKPFRVRRTATRAWSLGPRRKRRGDRITKMAMPSH